MSAKITITTHEEEIEKFLSSDLKFDHDSHRRIYETHKKIIEVYAQLDKIRENMDNIWQKIDKSSIKLLTNNDTE